jgi:hypothetical protein
MLSDLEKSRANFGRTEQALEKGIAVIDWIRFAISLAYREENFVRNLSVGIRWHTELEAGDQFHTDMISTTCPSVSLFNAIEHNF